MPGLYYVNVYNRVHITIIIFLLYRYDIIA